MFLNVQPWKLNIFGKNYLSVIILSQASTVDCPSLNIDAYITAIYGTESQWNDAVEEKKAAMSESFFFLPISPYEFYIYFKSLIFYTIPNIPVEDYHCNRVFSKPLCQRFGKKLPITVCDGIINLKVHVRSCDFCQIFLFGKGVLCDFVEFTKNIKCSFTVFIYSCLYS